ncbi:hypothetical protein [Palleronia caenipelagi]|uniref:Calcium-binding protein n=1 Tax=Palleronia caenipelagi TaxID=2489174 RepID=A0A547PI78_9RHOB|nr:hypothetical protein [Palleronia caenipelagi]TRD13831.1 hypothetical protein FEV53_19880 [Palleronia caenipelagi]
MKKLVHDGNLTEISRNTWSLDETANGDGQPGIDSIWRFDVEAVYELVYVNPFATTFTFYLDTEFIGFGEAGENDRLVADIDGWEAHRSQMYFFGDAQEFSGNGIGGNDDIRIRNNDDMAAMVVLGDAEWMYDQSVGGSDLIKFTGSGSAGYVGINGDSIYMVDQSSGGDDRISLKIADVRLVHVAGEGYTLEGEIDCGDDYITIDGYDDKSGLSTTSPAIRVSGDARVYLFGESYAGDDRIRIGDFANGDIWVYGDSKYAGEGVTYGEDTIHVGDGAAIVRVFGDAENGNSGADDRIFGGSHGGKSQLYGEGEFLFLESNAVLGDDLIVAGDGNTTSTMVGDARTIDFSRGVQSVSVVLGNDVLVSGRGADEMWGDVEVIRTPTIDITFGADRFVFAPGSGSDVIHDFRSEDGDRIDLSDYGFTGLEELEMAGEVISLETGSQITLNGLDTATLTADDFIFT